MEITVFRAGHRPFRDKRITTHVALVSRAFGASSILVDTKDEDLEKTLNRVSREFGGNFSIKTGVNWKKEFSSFSGVKVYLTMYGETLDSAVQKILAEKENEKIAILVGAEKMPPSAYDDSDYNVAVTNQPHSEVAALAIFMDRLQSGKEFSLDFSGHTRVYPAQRGKVVRVLPDRKECIDLLRKHNADERLTEHCLKVAELALEIADLAGADSRLVEAGALLHDIGKTQEHGHAHALAGASILRDEQVLPEVVRIVQRHSGAGITESEALEMGLPLGIYVPETLEEKIVAQADNMVRGRDRVPVQATIERYRKKGLENAAERIELLHLELSKKCGVDLNSLVNGRSKSIS